MLLAERRLLDAGRDRRERHQPARARPRARGQLRRALAAQRAADARRERWLDARERPDRASIARCVDRGRRGGGSTCSTSAAVAALGRFDVILCRNVLIYFSDETRARVGRRAWRRGCGPGGVLFVGVSESLLRFGTSLLARSATASSSTGSRDERTRRSGCWSSTTRPSRARCCARSLRQRAASRSSASRATGWRRSRRSPSSQPDVVTLDLVMPNLDGLGVLRALPAGASGRASSWSASRTPTASSALEALQLGAFDLVHKPTALATDRLYELSRRSWCARCGRPRRAPRAAPRRRRAAAAAGAPPSASARTAESSSIGDVHRRAAGAHAPADARCPRTSRCRSRSRCTSRAGTPTRWRAGSTRPRSFTSARPTRIGAVAGAAVSRAAASTSDSSARERRVCQLDVGR